MFFNSLIPFVECPRPLVLSNLAKGDQVANSICLCPRSEPVLGERSNKRQRDFLTAASSESELVDKDIIHAFPPGI